MARTFIMSCPICDTPIYEDDAKIGKPGWYYHRDCRESLKPSNDEALACLSDTDDEE